MEREKRISDNLTKRKLIRVIVAVVIVVSAVSLGNMSLGQHERETGHLPVLQDDSDGWQSLFDGKTLKGWEMVRYSGGGEPYVRNGAIVLPRATVGVMTGVRWVGEPLPVNNYVVYYEARRVVGGDIFAALTFPYDDTFASLVFGGWGGIVNGLSSIDGYDASENETTQYFSYTNNLWYPVELRATTDSIRAYVGSERVVNIATAGKDLHLRSDILDTGLTLWSYNSGGEIRNIRIKRIEP